MRIHPLLHRHVRVRFLMIGITVLSLTGLVAMFFYSQSKTTELRSRAANQEQVLKANIETLSTNVTAIQKGIEEKQAEIDTLKNEDQRKKNEALQKELTELKKTYLRLVALYEDLVDLKESSGKKSPLDTTFAAALLYLSKENYASAAAQLAVLETQIKAETDKLAAGSTSVAASVPVNNTAPTSGYSRQNVHTASGDFLVDIVAGDLNSTRVIVDTASDSTCTDNCPVLPLGTYVSRSGAYAGVNGTYFCPESYPSCLGKKNSFDLLVMNKQKTYFNSDNNVYSQNPVAVFSGNSARFLSKAQDWGRDTGVDAVISNFPLLLINGQNQFSGNSDPKMGSRGTRSFIGAKGSTAYIGVVKNVTVAQMATVLQTLGLDHAMNLDSGGSTALWANGGYKAGPGRTIPNAVLFVRK